MTKFMPPYPEWLSYPCEQFTKQAFDKWYAKEIAALFDGAHEVIGHHYEDRANGKWSKWRPEIVEPTHRALLIKIEPIKEIDEGQKLIQEMIDYFAHFKDLECCLEGKWSDRAKAFLAKKEWE